MSLLKIIGIAVSAFLLGFGAYAGLLKLLRLTPVNIEEYIKSESHQNEINKYTKNINKLKKIHQDEIAILTKKEMFGIKVLDATYGGNRGKPRGNVTRFVKSQCDTLQECNYYINHYEIGDPAPMQAKDFLVRWNCGDLPRILAKKVEAEATFKFIKISCKDSEL